MIKALRTKGIRRLKKKANRIRKVILHPGAASAGKTKSTGLFGGKIDIKYNDEYDFTGRIYMQMETYDKNDVIKSDFYTYFNSGTNWMRELSCRLLIPKTGKHVLSTCISL